MSETINSEMETGDNEGANKEKRKEAGDSEKMTHKEGGGEEVHRCDLCGQTLSSRNSLKRHMRTHSDERPFKCSHCPNTYKAMESLKRHMKTSHPETSNKPLTKLPSTDQNKEKRKTGPEANNEQGSSSKKAKSSEEEPKRKQDGYELDCCIQ
eukprot:TRINITY_DN6610_c0_g1_i2.p1 TRINITY_DN6610_c0_g1~~TRINITY_DN6610_c0_g1_i2.p1  ORF type:complete len:153 (-),score=38.96 TRINITY_DN6610_c0_g1_i2:62-520(-)